MRPADLPLLRRLVFASTLVNGTFNFAFPMLAVLLTETTKRSADEAAMIIVAAQLISSLVQPWVGRLIDRHRFTRPLALAVVGNVAGILALFSTSWLVVFAGATAFLTSVGTLGTLGTHVVEGLANESTRRALALRNYMLLNLGFACGGILSYVFLKTHRDILLALDVASTLVSCAVFAFCSRRLAAAPASPHPSDTERWSRVLTPRMLVTMLSVLVLSTAMAAPFSCLPFLYRELGLDAARYTAFVFGCNSIIVVGSVLVVPRLNLNLKARVLGGSALVAVGMSLQPLIDSIATCAVFTASWAIGEAMLVGEMAAAIFRAADARHAGAASGLKTFTIRMANVICPLLSVASPDDRSRLRPGVRGDVRGRGVHSLPRPDPTDFAKVGNQPCVVASSVFSPRSFPRRGQRALPERDHAVPKRAGMVG